MLDSNLNKLSLAEQLMHDAKFEEALEVITNIEKKEAISSKEQLSVLILKGRLFNYKEQYKEAVKIGEELYYLSQKQDKVSFSIDALLIRAYIVFHGKFDRALDHISKAEKLINSNSYELSENLLRQKADLLLVKSIYYRFTGDINKAVELALQWLEIKEEIGANIDISLIFYNLGYLYLLNGEPNTALEYAMKSLELQKELDNQIGISSSLYLVGISHYSMGDFDIALNFCKQSLAMKEISIFSRIGVFHLLGAIYKEKGELDKTLIYYNQAANLAEREDYIEGFIENLMGIGAIYRIKGDYDQASEYLKRSLGLSKNIKSLLGMNASLFYLILLNLDNNYIEQAQIYLSQLEELADQTGSKVFTQVYLISKALVLKKSGRIRNRTEAEIILKQIAEEKTTTPPLYLLVLVNLCDLFLEELYITNNPEVLGELNPLISSIYKIAESQHSYLYLAETKLLQAKLALIQMNIDESKKLLTQAQQIAEEHGLNLLAAKISNEHDNLLEQTNIWENLKKTNAPISERIKLASFEGVIDRLQGKRAVKAPELTPEVPVLLLIIAEGGVLLFSYPFSKEWKFDDEFFGGFLTVINSFSDEIFSEGLDRVKFGKHTALMESVGSFSVCYLYKGQTYPAKQKLTKFTECIQKTTSIWQVLEKFHKTNLLVEIKDIPSLGTIISEIFT